MTLTSLFLQNIYDNKRKQFKTKVFLNLLLGSLLFYILSLLTIYAVYFAILAEVNFGIIASCISLSTPLNCLLSYILYNEKLTKRMLIGTSIIFMGVIWVALAKGKVIEAEAADGLTPAQQNHYRIISITLAILLGVINAARTAHGKYMNTQLKYPPMDFTID